MFAPRLLPATLVSPGHMQDGAMHDALLERVVDATAHWR
jgi:hypothetical protein